MIPSCQARPLFLLALLFAPVGVIAPKALVLLLFIAALWLLARRWRQDQLRRPFHGTAIILAAVMGAWALLSAIWALDAVAALWTFAKLAGLTVATLIVLDGLKDLDAGDSGSLRRALLAAFALAALLLGLESLSGAPLHQWWFDWRGGPGLFQKTALNRSGTLLLLAAWPCALVLAQQGRRAWALAVIAASLAVIMLGVSSTNQLAAAAAVAGAVLAWWTGPWLQRLLAGLLVVGILTAPVLPATLLAPERLSEHFGGKYYSGLHRLYIWHFAATRIADAPVLGWGLDASRRIPGGDTELPGGGKMMSLHPHNASLQIWLELGGVGAVLWALFLAGLWLHAGRLPRRSERAAATGLLLAGLIVAHLSFGIWQTWWLVALAQSGIIFALALRQGRQPENG
ncbi:MAG: O-antigen ligase family protein [Alphaproteobacteria bacterium]|nr:O-antigen ligase family protein [Alphaproteobacteria bacterium]